MDVARHPKMFATDLNGPDEGTPDAGPVDDRSGRRQGARGATRRPRPGVPARRRAAGRASHTDTATAPRSKPVRSPTARSLKHDFERGTTTTHDYGDGPGVGRGGVRPPHRRRRRGRRLGDVARLRRRAPTAATSCILDAQDFAGEHRSPPSTSRNGCPSDSTATGSPTPDRCCPTLKPIRRWGGVNDAREDAACDGDVVVATRSRSSSCSPPPLCSAMRFHRPKISSGPVYVPLRRPRPGMIHCVLGVKADANCRPSPRANASYRLRTKRALACTGA